MSPVVSTCRVLFCGLLSMLPLAEVVAAEAFTWDETSLRAGVRVRESDGAFFRYDLAFAGQTPWNCQWSEAWHLDVRWEASLGLLHNRDRDGFIASVGPVLALSKDGWPVVVKAGVSPTILSETKFEDANFGHTVQFTSHVGAVWKISESFSLDYRFSHMSNAGLDNRNPGLNLHQLGFHFQF